MKDIRPYICQKLKDMEASGDPVWISLGNYRYKVRPYNWETDEFYGGLLCLVTHKSYYKVITITEKDGIWTNDLGPRRYHFPLEKIKAIIIEEHKKNNEIQNRRSSKDQ
jgi:hypothetical protein